MPFRFDNAYARLPAHFFARAALRPAPAPRWLAVNVDLGASLGLSAEELRSTEMLLALAGNRAPEGAEPIALAYAGHQFGGFVPRPGDGRALLLGAALDAHGRRWDVQLQGWGPPPAPRGAHGCAGRGARGFWPDTHPLASELTARPAKVARLAGRASKGARMRVRPLERSMPISVSV